MNMRSLLACTVLAAAAVTAPAAATDGPPGVTVVYGTSGPCIVAGVTDPGTEGGDVITGAVASTPVLGDGRLTCTVQVGGVTHDGSDAVSRRANGTDVVVLLPEITSFVAPEDVPLYLCAEFWSSRDGRTVYWDGYSQTWSSSPYADCDLLSGFDTRDTSDPVFYEFVDPWVCPAIAFMLPPDGDIPGVYDCPPYGR